MFGFFNRLHLTPARLWEKAAAALPPVLLLAAWWGLAVSGWFPAKIVVPPDVVAGTIWEMTLSGELGAHVGASLSRLAGGYVIGAALGLLLGGAMGLSTTAHAYVHPSFQLLRQLPTIALLPAFVMLLGVGETLKVVLVAKAALLPIGLATLEGVKGVPRSYFDLASVYQASHRVLFFRVILPAAVAPVLSGMRIGLTRAWVVLVGAELLVAQNGLGQMMEWGRQMFRIDIVLAGVALTGVIGFFLDRALRRVERLVEA